MSSITYSLKGGQAASNNYYEKAERLSKKVILDVFSKWKGISTRLYGVYSEKQSRSFKD